MIHGDADDEVCILNCFLGQALALSSHDNSQMFLLLEDRVGEGDAIVTKGHCGGLEARIVQLPVIIQPSPRHEKYSAHRDAYRPAVQGVT